MSRIKDLKEKYPILSLSVADLLEMIDPTDQNKYLSMLGRIVKNKVEERFNGEDAYKTEMSDIIGDSYVESQPCGYSYILYQLMDLVGGRSSVEVFKKFIEMNERGVIENNDIQQYNSIDDLQAAISLIELKEMDKEMAAQVVKTFEDDTWLVVRPLTFESSCKYGAGTKWCTTASSEPQHFHRYWSRGALIYIINKKTGYKVATQRYYDDSDRSTLWNAADREMNWADVDVDNHIFNIVKTELSLKVTNQSLCSDEVQERVKRICLGEQFRLVEQPTEVGRIYINPNPPNPARLDLALLDALRNEVHDETEQIGLDEPTVEMDQIPVVDLSALSIHEASNELRRMLNS